MRENINNNEQLEREKLLCRLSWLQGYGEALYDYGVWKDGEMVLGCGVIKYRDALVPINKDIEEIKMQLVEK